jgi:hypothetical protein
MLRKLQEALNPLSLSQVTVQLVHYNWLLHGRINVFSILIYDRNSFLLDGKICYCVYSENTEQPLRR